MKKQLQLLLMILFVFSMLITKAQDSNDGKIVVEITKDINGEKKTFKGEYENAEQMRADPNYQEFAGEDDGFNSWFDDEGSEKDLHFHLDQLKNLRSGSFNFGFDDEEGSTRIFKHLHGEDAEEGTGFFQFDNFDMAEHEEDMKALGIEMQALIERLGESEDGSVFVLTLKSIKVTEVDGDEFGKKGEVRENNKLELEDLRFSPNPSPNGRFHVRFRVPEENELNIKVFNLEGKEVYNRYFERFGGTYSESIDLSGQKEGIYLLEISQGNRRVTKKIIIN